MVWILLFVLALLSLSWQGYRYAVNEIIAPHMRYVNADGQRIMKILLITKNERYLIKSWVLHHGRIFGFDNLHILDSSDDPVTLEFLRHARDRLGVDVTFSSADLNDIEAQFNRKLESMKEVSDFMIKLDTDELLVLYEHNATFKVDRKSIMEYLATLPNDGLMFKASWISSSIVERDKCRDEDDVFKTSTKFAPFLETWQKTYFSSKSYRHLDLGGHSGWIHPALIKNRSKRQQFHTTRLGFFHYHSQCFHRVVENNLRAILSHRYLDGNEDKDTAIKKLEVLLGPNYPSICAVLSCHKVWDYVAYLKDHEASERLYYEKYGPSSTHIETTTIKESIEQNEKSFENV